MHCHLNQERYGKKTETNITFHLIGLTILVLMTLQVRFCKLQVKKLCQTFYAHH